MHDGQIGMAQLTEHAPLLQEERLRLLNRLWVGRIGGDHLLDSRPLAQLDMAGFVDTPHPALGQQTLDSMVPANDPPGDQRPPPRHL